MARIPKGILGPVDGTVGTVIGGSWRGIHYIRSKPGGRKGGSSVAQLDAQLKFITVVDFVYPLTPVVELTFNRYAIKMSGYNAAFAYNYNNALGGKTPDYTIDYAKALVSRGDLPNANDPKATASDASVYFTWEDNSGVGKALATDKAIVVVYCEELKSTLFSNDAAVRSTGAASLNVKGFLGRKVQTWLAFLSEDGREAANSFYTGELVIK